MLQVGHLSLPFERTPARHTSSPQVTVSLGVALDTSGQVVWQLHALYMLCQRAICPLSSVPPYRPSPLLLRCSLPLLTLGKCVTPHEHFVASRASSVYTGKSCMKQRLPLAPSDGTGDGAVVPWSGGTHCSQQRRETSTLQKPLSSSTEKVTPWHYTQGFQVQFNTRI